MPRVNLRSNGHLIVEDSGVVLHSELGTLVLEGREVANIAARVLALLNGSSTCEDIVASFSEDLRENVRLMLEILERQGLLDSIDEPPANPFQSHLKAQARFFRYLSGDSANGLEKLTGSRVLIVGSEPSGIVAARELAAAGVGKLHMSTNNELPEDASPEQLQAFEHSSAQELSHELSTSAPWCRVTVGSQKGAEALLAECSVVPWDLLIGAMSPDDLAGRWKWARLANQGKLPSLFASYNSLECFVGPLVIPGKTACWNCARLRLLANAEYPWAAHALQHTLLKVNHNRPIVSAFCPMASLSGQLLALEALKFLSGFTQSLIEGQVLVQNLITLKASLHPVIPLPWCEVCGGAAALRCKNDETHNWGTTEDPKDLSPLSPGWVDSLTGVISHAILRRLETFKSRSLFCAQALLANYTEGFNSAETPDNCGGKGLTKSDAFIGAVGEAIERYSASRYRLADMLSSPLPDNEESFLDARALCLYTDEQYLRDDFPFVPFDPSRSHRWVAGRWLDNDETVWVPARMTFYNFPDSADDSFCQTTSNGLAAGKGLNDATLRALLELVERDAFMISWLCRRSGRRLTVDDSLTDGTLDVLAELEQAGAQVELYLLSTDHRIPVVACLAFGDGKSWPGLTVTSAAHLSPRLAVRNAILEQGYSGVYLRHVMLQQTRAVPTAPERIRNWNFLDHGLFYLPPARAAAADFLRSSLHGAIPLRNIEEPANFSLDYGVRQLTSAGIRVAVVDVTAPDVAQTPFRVVRALGTNMQPIHCGYGLERLANPRLAKFMSGELNKDVHPLC